YRYGGCRLQVAQSKRRRSKIFILKNQKPLNLDTFFIGITLAGKKGHKEKYVENWIAILKRSK
ncbi:MAG: hypothetical protein ACI85U_003148, partial [Candidatus Promineifilaceae bacterium]